MLGCNSTWITWWTWPSGLYQLMILLCFVCVCFCIKQLFMSPSWTWTTHSKGRPLILVGFSLPLIGYTHLLAVCLICHPMPHSADQPTLEQRWTCWQRGDWNHIVSERMQGEKPGRCLSKIQASKKHMAGCGVPREGTIVHQDVQ